MRNRAWRRYTKDKIFKYRLLRVIKRYGSETIRSTLDSSYYYKLKKHSSEFSYCSWGWGKHKKRAILKEELYKELNYDY